MTHSSLIYTRTRIPGLDKPIRAFTGGQAGHVGVCIGAQVIDMTLWHRCHTWDRDEWLSHRVLVAEDEVVPASAEAGAAAVAWARRHAELRTPYDWREILGFALLRELGDQERYVCSSFAARYLELATGVAIPDRRARRDPRHVRIASGMYLAGLRQAATSAT